MCQKSAPVIFKAHVEEARIEAKDEGSSDCLSSWADATVKAGDYDKRGYLN